jgi:hypothetical protein
MTPDEIRSFDGILYTSNRQDFQRILAILNSFA